MMTKQEKDFGLTEENVAGIAKRIIERYRAEYPDERIDISVFLNIEVRPDEPGLTSIDPTERTSINVTQISEISRLLSRLDLQE